MDSITCQEKVPHNPKVKSESHQYLLLGQCKGLPLFSGLHCLLHISTTLLPDHEHVIKKPLRWFPIAQDKIKYDLQSSP